jgi:hypothetical protein
MRRLFGADSLTLEQSVLARHGADSLSLEQSVLARHALRRH